MLRRLKSFRGLLICSTNRLEALQPADLRRFHLKLALDYGVASRSRPCCVRKRLLGLPTPRAALLIEAVKLRRCSPGDFAALARRHRFAPFTSAKALL